MRGRGMLSCRISPSSLRGARRPRGMGMTTVWRPRVRIAVPNVGDAENTDTSRDELTKKGTKRKRAPKHHGPCEHGVKHRSNCKVCSACPHGRRRSRVQGVRWVTNLRARSSALMSARSAVGHAICEHGRHALVSARSAVGASICKHGRQRSQCKECGGASICEHGRRALSVQGVRWVSNLRARSWRSECKECGGASICEHGRRALSCKECGGSGICEHGRQRSMCKECGGASICEHGRQRTTCKECGGASICEHGRRRYRCKECRGS